MKSLLPTFFITFLFSFVLSCSTNKQTLSLLDSKEVGFVSDGSYVLSDPPSGRARIYFFRDKSVVGSYLGFTVRIEYEPKLNFLGTPRYKNYQDSLGYLSTGKTFFADIWAGHRVAIMVKTEAISYLIFTPLEGQIYCIRGYIKNGFTMPRANIAFVSKGVCEESWIDYFKSENLDFQNQWRKVYNERKDKILIEPPFKTQKSAESVESVESKSSDSEESLESSESSESKESFSQD